MKVHHRLCLIITSCYFGCCSASPSTQLPISGLKLRCGETKTLSEVPFDQGRVRLEIKRLSADSVEDLEQIISSLEVRRVGRSNQKSSAALRTFAVNIKGLYDGNLYGGDLIQIQKQKQVVVLLSETRQRTIKLKLFRINPARSTSTVVPRALNWEQMQRASARGDRPTAAISKSFLEDFAPVPRSAHIESATSRFVTLRIERYRVEPTRLRYDFKTRKWSEIKPTKAQLTQKAKRAVHQRWMGNYKGYRELGLSREKAIQQTREFSGVKNWTPLKEAWDTPDFNPPKLWLTPQPSPSATPVP